MKDSGDKGTKNDRRAEEEIRNKRTRKRGMRRREGRDEQTRRRGNKGTSVQKTSGREQGGFETMETRDKLTRDDKGMRRESNGIEY